MSLDNSPSVPRIHYESQLPKEFAIKQGFKYSDYQKIMKQNNNNNNSSSSTSDSDNEEEEGNRLVRFNEIENPLPKPEALTPV
jgi:hypothetical protein